jgi:Mg/Co/Ni transporter MgtE
MKRYVGRLPEPARGRVLELLRYPEDTVGGVMVNDVVRLPADMSGQEAAEAIRERLQETDFSSLVFVVNGDEGQELRGTVPLPQLLSMGPDQKLEDVMDPYIATLDPLQPAKKAAHRLLDSGHAAMPVTAKDGRLIGAMTLDAAMSVLFASSSELQTLRIFS